ncbi:hypothetical protein P4S52_15190 [Vibrio sp. SA48]|uniref:hypothetical protein n=1 Tax=Vibrio sp. S12_S33 TaxID=2720223 RepID=UPI001EE1D3D5|nr:hypothetical protein [Vibrio sp. S12_S33]
MKVENSTILNWNDEQIPHQIYLEQLHSGCRIVMKIVKDIEPEILVCNLNNIKKSDLEQSWIGEAFSVSPAYNDGTLFNQTRVLFNLTSGCIVWAVTHIEMPNGQKMSADRLVFVPGMIAGNEKLVAIKSGLKGNY